MRLLGDRGAHCAALRCAVLCNRTRSPNARTTSPQRHNYHRTHARTRCREEFLHAMALLRDELGWDEAELGTVFSAIDCHGHVSREQFADILIAEELRDPSADAELLRHLTRSSQRPPSLWS